MENMRFVYVTCPDTMSAEVIAQKVVEKKLAACANIFPAMQSVYMDKGKIVKSRETSMIIKTQAATFSALCDAITSNHPYDTPCILELPVLRGNAAYTSWMEEQLNS